jgi:hypothetical protein
MLFFNKSRHPAVFGALRAECGAWLNGNKASPDDFTSTPTSWVLVSSTAITGTQWRLYENRDAAHSTHY